MNRVLILLLVTLSYNCFSQTQVEINKKAYAEFNKADKALNKVYEQIFIRYKADTIFLETLKKSQRIWIKFRDAELEMKYPNYSDMHYGTVHPICRSLYLTGPTKKRSKNLKIWLNRIEKDDVYASSVK